MASQAPNPPSPPNLPAYSDKLKEILDLRKKIASTLKALLGFTNFHVSFQAICFGSLMATNFARCQTAWYISVLAGLVALPNAFFIIKMVTRYNNLMTSYDKVWPTFKELETPILAAYPDDYREVRYDYSILWYDTVEKETRDLLVLAGLSCLFIFTLLAFAGPFVFLCGFKTRG